MPDYDFMFSRYYRVYRKSSEEKENDEEQE